MYTSPKKLICFHLFRKTLRALNVHLNHLSSLLSSQISVEEKLCGDLSNLEEEPPLNFFI